MDTTELGPDTQSLAESAPAEVLPDLTRSMELVQEVQDGDVDALNELFQRYRHRLERIVRIKMGARLRSFLEAEDLMQEVYLVAMQNLGELELRSHASILQWLSKITEYQVRKKVDYFSAQKRDRGREIHLTFSPGSTALPAARVGELADSAPNPAEKALRAEFRQLIDSYVETLEPEAYRNVIIYRDYYGGDWSYVRDRLKRPTVEAVQELYRRAHAKLRRAMQPHFKPQSKQDP